MLTNNIYNNSIIKAVIFDFDGLLVNTEYIFFSALKSTYKDYGIDFTKYDYVSTDLQNGKSSLEHYYSSGLIDSIKKRELSTELYNRYFRLVKEKLRPMPGAIPVIRQLANHFDLAIASSSKKIFISYILNQLKLSNYFKVIVSRESTKNLKPDPDCLIMAAKKLGFKQKECVLIEDSLRGLSAALAANMPCIIVPNKLTIEADYSRANIVLKSLIQLTPELIYSIYLSDRKR